MCRFALFTFAVVVAFTALYVVWELNDPVHDMTDKTRLRASAFTVAVFVAVLGAGFYYATVP